MKLVSFILMIFETFKALGYRSFLNLVDFAILRFIVSFWNLGTKYFNFEILNI